MNERVIETRRGLKARIFEAGEGRPVLFLHSSGKKIGPVHIENLAEALVGFWKKGGFEDVGLIFEGDKFHWVTFASEHLFAGDGPGS